MFKLRSLPDMLPALYLQQPYDSSSDARIISDHFRIPESKTQEWHSLNMLRGWYYLISLPGRYWYVVSIGSSHTSLVSSLIWGPVSVYIAGLLPGTHPTWSSTYLSRHCQNKSFDDNPSAWVPLLQVACCYKIMEQELDQLQHDWTYNLNYATILRGSDYPWSHSSVLCGYLILLITPGSNLLRGL